MRCVFRRSHAECVFFRKSHGPSGLASKLCRIQVVIKKEDRHSQTKNVEIDSRDRKNSGELLIRSRELLWIIEGGLVKCPRSVTKVLVGGGYASGVLFSVGKLYLNCVDRSNKTHRNGTARIVKNDANDELQIARGVCHEDGLSEWGVGFSLAEFLQLYQIKIWAAAVLTRQHGL